VPWEVFNFLFWCGNNDKNVGMYYLVIGTWNLILLLLVLIFYWLIRFKLGIQKLSGVKVGKNNICYVNVPSFSLLKFSVQKSFCSQNVYFTVCLRQLYTQMYCNN